MEPADVVLRFLESVGRRSEAEFYLALFRALPKEGFAAIAVDAGVARHAGEAVVLDLRFLASLGLWPLVLLGLLESSNATAHATRIVRRLSRAGVRATIVANQPADDLPARVAATIGAATLPVLVLDPIELPSVEQRFARVAELLDGLRTRKLIFLHRPGALRARGGAPISLVNLTTEFDALAAGRELSRKEQLIVGGARRLVCEQVAHPLTIAITSPLDLLRELFSERGAGTLLRRGSIIERRAGFDGVDQARLHALLASSFGRDPDPDALRRPVARLYLEEHYRGVAIVCDTPLGAYLTKFAVEREAQGEGLGRDLWAEVRADHVTLFWRARAANPIAPWYTRQCDGMARAGEWQVFWRGLPVARIAEAVEWALGQPLDFPPAA